MINANVVPSWNAGRIVDAFEIAFGDPLILTGKKQSGEEVEFQFPPGTKVSIRTSRILSATRINGRNGTIKEMAGYDDFSVDIDYTIMLTAYDLSLPVPDMLSSVQNATGLKSVLEEIKELRDLWRIEAALDVTNQRLDTLGIERLVLTDFDLPDNPTYWQQDVRIRCLSDRDYEFVDLSEGETPEDESLAEEVSE